MTARMTAAKGAMLALLMLTVLASCVKDDAEDSATATALVNVGDAMPLFSLTASDGVVVTSASLSGKVYVMNFFDTRCPDCQQELQVLQRVYDSFGPQVTILNVPRSQTGDEVQRYWQESGLTMPFHIAADKELYYKFATGVIPRTYIVDGSGKVHAAFDDSPVADYDTLGTVLGSLLEQQTRSTVGLRLRLNVVAGTADDYYFHNEYTISRLEVWFFDAETKAFCAKAVAQNLTQAETLSDAQYDITYLYDDFRLRGGVYDIFAIANYDHSPDTVEDEAELLNMVDAITYSSGVEANVPDTGPVMTSNAGSHLAVDLTPWVGQDYVISMDLERVIAKLQVGVSQNSFPLMHGDRKYADVNITNYKLVNLIRQYYLFQHKDSLTELTPQPTFTLAGHFGDYADEGNQYVVDPLFYDKTLIAADAARVGNSYKSWFGTFTTSDFASMPSAFNYGYAYVLENTAFKACQKNGYSPGVVFKAAVSPVFVYLWDSRERTLKEEYRPEYWPNTIYLYKYNFYESLQAVNVAGNLALDELESYTDAQLWAYGIKQCKFNMGVYETYYTYWISHRNSAVDHMGPMQYGIVRNNYYRLLVTGITGIGNSVITPDILRDNYPNSYSDVIVENE